MGGLIAGFMAYLMIILYLALVIYLIWLFIRLVRAVETIARKVEGSSKI
jgi:flagellar biogenesis protein FliO